MKRFNICIDGNEMRMVVHREDSDRSCFVEIPETCMRNGMIVDEEIFTDTVRELISTCPFKISRADLEVRFGHVYTKYMDIPCKVRSNEILYAVKAEFSFLENVTDMIYDYSEFCTEPEDKTRRILGGCMERSDVKNFEKCFAKAGITLTGMDVVDSRMLENDGMRSKKFNFLAASKKKDSKSIEIAGVFSDMVRAAGIFGSSFIILFGILAAGNLYMEKRLEELITYTEDEENLRIYYERIRFRETAEIYEKGIQCVRAMNIGEKSKNEPNGNLILWIEDIPGAESCHNYSYSGEEGIFSFTCLTEDCHEISDYVEILRSEDLFSDVFYSGYTRDESTKEYSFSISCEIVQ